MDALHDSSRPRGESEPRPAVGAESSDRLRDDVEALGLLLGMLGIILVLVLTLGSTARFGA